MYHVGMCGLVWYLSSSISTVMEIRSTRLTTGGPGISDYGRVTLNHKLKILSHVFWPFEALHAHDKYLFIAIVIPIQHQKFDTCRVSCWNTINYLNSHIHG